MVSWRHNILFPLTLYEYKNVFSNNVMCISSESDRHTVLITFLVNKKIKKYRQNIIIFDYRIRRNTPDSADFYLTSFFAALASFFDGSPLMS